MTIGVDRAFVDLHCHTRASFDCLSSPAAVARLAAERGLTHLAITDHHRLDGALEARAAAPLGLTVIVGEEIRTTGGDLLGLYLERPVPMGLSPADAAAAIREQGGLVGLPHPFDRFRSSGAAKIVEAAALAALAESVDLIEAHNARALGHANEQATRFARDQGRPGVASSDAHTVLEVGVAYTILSGDPRSAAEMRVALDDIRLVTGRATFFVRAWTPLAKLVQRARGNRRGSTGSTASLHPGAPA